MAGGEAPFPDELYRSAASALVRALLREPIRYVRGRCRPEDLRRVLAEYPASFVPLPPEAFEHTSVVAVPAEPDTWVVDQPLWSREEGQSDLVLRMRVHLAGAGRLEVEIDDLLVP